jgi:poly(3-hydroxybutyrate) depolymerase
MLLISLFFWYANTIQKRADEDNKNVLEKKVLKIGNQSRDCYLSSSIKKLKGKKSPLVIFLHGMDGAWPNRYFTKPQYEYINKSAWKKNFIAVFPKGTLGACNAENDHKYLLYYCWSAKNNTDRDFLISLKDTVVSLYDADPKKVYLLGFSNGGYYVADYLTHYSHNDFAGYGINSAGGELPENSSLFKDKFPVSLNVGNKDEYQLEPMRKLKNNFVNLGWKLGENLQYQEFDARHEMSKNALDSEIDFLLNNK